MDDASDAAEECAVCLDATKDTLECGHPLCRTCAQRWRSKGKETCPVCRRPNLPPAVDDASTLTNRSFLASHHQNDDDEPLSPPPLLRTTRTPHPDGVEYVVPIERWLHHDLLQSGRANVDASFFLKRVTIRTPSRFQYRRTVHGLEVVGRTPYNPWRFLSFTSSFRTSRTTVSIGDTITHVDYAPVLHPLFDDPALRGGTLTVVCHVLERDVRTRLFA